MPFIMPPIIPPGIGVAEFIFPIPHSPHAHSTHHSIHHPHHPGVPEDPGFGGVELHNLIGGDFIHLVGASIHQPGHVHKTEGEGAWICRVNCVCFGQALDLREDLRQWGGFRSLPVDFYGHYGKFRAVGKGVIHPVHHPTHALHGACIKCLADQFHLAARRIFGKVCPYLHPFTR